MSNSHEPLPTAFVAGNETGVVEIPFLDQNGDDLGSWNVEPEQTVDEVVEEVIKESGLPVRNPDGSAKLYEAYQDGRKVARSASVAEAGIDPAREVEIFPSVTTGAAG